MTDNATSASSSDATESLTQILIDGVARIVWIRDGQVDHKGFEYIDVPQGVNIFKLLTLKQPFDVTNISDWKVGICPQNKLYPNISHILEVSWKICQIASKTLE